MVICGSSNPTCLKGTCIAYTCTTGKVLGHWAENANMKPRKHEWYFFSSDHEKNPEKNTKQTQNESLKIRLFNQQHTILTVLDSFSFCLYCIHKSCWKCIYKCSYVFDSQSLFITVLGLSVCLFSMSLRYQGEKPRGIIIFWIIQWRSFRNALKRNQNPRAIPNSNISLVT